MVSFLFHSKGNSLFVNQQYIIQNHLFFTVLLEKMGDVATSVQTVGIRAVLGLQWVGPGWEAVGGPPPARPESGRRAPTSQVVPPCHAQRCQSWGAEFLPFPSGPEAKYTTWDQLPFRIHQDFLNKWTNSCIFSSCGSGVLRCGKNRLTEW